MKKFRTGGAALVDRPWPRVFEIIATNDMAERIMTSPAISESILFIRAEKSIFAVGR